MEYVQWLRATTTALELGCQRLEPFPNRARSLTGKASTSASPATTVLVVDVLAHHCDEARLPGLAAFLRALADQTLFRHTLVLVCG